MQAVILAAGMGRRLGELTRDNTKCMIKVHNKTLIEGALENLTRCNAVTRIVMVIGYQGEKLKKFIGRRFNGVEVIYVDNPVYDKTNNNYSLFLAKDYLGEDDTLLLESDLIFERKIIERLLADPFPNLAVVDRYQSWMDGTVVRVDDDSNILQFIPKQFFDYSQIHSYFKTVNIYKFSKEFLIHSYIPFLNAYCSALGHNEYYEQVLRIITLLEKQDLKAFRLNGEKWYEIDDIQDLNNAETIFAPGENKLGLFQERYGGYWRFSGMLDFCYLVNPYFPPARLQEEMKCYLGDLLSRYPSGQNVQNLLAAKMFNCSKDEILVGNGAAELIKALFRSLAPNSRFGVIFPTFNEYPERIGAGNYESFTPANRDFAYNLEDLKKFCEKSDCLVLINPDNPSGNFISRPNLLTLLKHCRAKGKMLILDESFVDFSNEGTANSLLDSQILNTYPNLVLIKSISKSYGIPGIRLGVLASGNNGLIKKVRKELSIWNINALAEFFLQIFGKYDKDYIAACELIRAERERFRKCLLKIPFLRVVPSQANYFLCEVVSLFSSTELTGILLRKYDIFIKNCTGKNGFENKNYVRIAVRNRNDNEKLIDALKKLTKAGKKDHDS